MNIENYEFLPEYTEQSITSVMSNSVSTTLPSYPIVVGVYPAGGGLLANGAKKDVVTGFVGWLGGPADGSTTIEINVSMGVYPEGIYQFVIKYIAGDYRNFKVDINGVSTGILYTPPPTNSWTLRDAKNFIVSLRLIPGVNKIKFHGDGKNYAPDLGDITINILSSTFPAIEPTPVVNPITGQTTPITSPTTIPSIKPTTNPVPTTSTIPIVPPFPITTKYPILVGIYPAAKGVLISPAIPDPLTGFVSWIGGLLDGATTIDVNVNTGVYPAGIYQFLIQYLSAESRGFKVDINGVNTGVIYKPEPTVSWNLKDVKTFTLSLQLKTGINKIKFHGDGKNYAPNFGNITVNILSSAFPSIEPTPIVNPITGPITPITSPITTPLTNPMPTPTTTPTSTIPIAQPFPTPTKYPIIVGVYPAAKGILINPATRDSITGFASWLGGPLDGSTTIDVNVNTGVYPAGIYQFLIQYLSAESRGFKVDINGVNTGVIYKPEPTVSWNLKDVKTFTLSLQLKTGVNKIKFHGDGKNYSPNLGNVIVNILSNTFPAIDPIPTTQISPTIIIPGVSGVVGQVPLSTNSNLILSTYNIGLGALSGGAYIDLITNFVVNIGGVNDGASTLNVIAYKTGVYILAITYLSGDSSRTFKVDINNDNSQNVYTVSMTNSWNVSDANVYNIRVNLNAGSNVIKFYGDGVSNSPYLGSFNIEQGISPDSATIMLLGSANLNGHFIEGIGGEGDGQVVLTANVPYDGLYDFAIYYVASDNNKVLKIDVNGVNTQVVYNFDMTNSMNINDEEIKVISLQLIKGQNTIRLYN